MRFNFNQNRLKFVFNREKCLIMGCNWPPTVMKIENWWIIMASNYCVNFALNRHRKETDKIVNPSRKPSQASYHPTFIALTPQSRIGDNYRSGRPNEKVPYRTRGLLMTQVITPSSPFHTKYSKLRVKPISKFWVRSLTISNRLNLFLWAIFWEIQILEISIL